MQKSLCLRIDILWVCLAILRRAYLFGERIFLGVLYQGKSVAFTSDHSSLSRGWESMTTNGPTRTKVSWLLSCYPNTYDVSASAPLGRVGNPYDMKMRETVKGCYRLCAGRRYNLHNCKSDGWVSEYEYIYIYKSNSSGWGSQLSTFCFNVWSLEMFGHFCFLYLAHHGLCQSSCSNAKMLEKELSFFS